MTAKYLLLSQPEEEFPEQFNSYLFLIMEIMRLAQNLNRVFVSPYFHSHPRNSVLCERGETDHRKFILGKQIYPMESLFNIEKLVGYIEIMPFKDFVQISNKRLSCLYVFGKDYNKTIEIYGKEFAFGKSIRKKNIYEIDDVESPYIALTGCRRFKHALKNSPNWHNHPQMDYWKIRKSFEYKEDLISIAQNFIQKNFKDKYLAVHWRRGDRVHPELGRDKEDIVNDEKTMENLLQYYLIRPIKKIMNVRNLKKVFLATNCGTKWHLDYLEKNLPIVRYPTSGLWQNMLLESMIEQIICVNSDFYFSSPYKYEKCSSFSRWIIDSRMIIGKEKEKNIAYQKKMRQENLFALFKDALLYYIQFYLIKTKMILKIILTRIRLISVWKQLKTIYNDFEIKRLRKKKQRALIYYKNKFLLDTLVETGTYKGDMVFAMKDHFRMVYSVELGDDLYEKAKERFSDAKNISILHGDSGETLSEILLHINEPCLFWLDAHSSRGDTVRGIVETPIMKELLAIFSHPNKKHIILIDDARGFNGTHDHPTIVHLQKYIQEKAPEYRYEIENDIIRITPFKQGKEQ